MVIGVVEVDLQVSGSTSLKMKRAVIKSLKDHIHNKFNVSIAEVSQMSSVRTCTLGIVQVSNDKKFTNRVLSDVVNYIEGVRSVELTDYRLMFL